MQTDNNMLSEQSGCVAHKRGHKGGNGQSAGGGAARADQAGFGRKANQERQGWDTRRAGKWSTHSRLHDRTGGCWNTSRRSPDRTGTGPLCFCCLLHHPPARRRRRPRRLELEKAVRCLTEVSGKSGEVWTGGKRRRGGDEVGVGLGLGDSRSGTLGGLGALGLSGRGGVARRGREARLRDEGARRGLRDEGARRGCETRLGRAHYLGLLGQSDAMWPGGLQ